MGHTPDAARQLWRIKPLTLEVGQPARWVRIDSNSNDVQRSPEEDGRSEGARFGDCCEGFSLGVAAVGCNERETAAFCSYDMRQMWVPACRERR